MRKRIGPENSQLRSGSFEADWLSISPSINWKIAPQFINIYDRTASQGCVESKMIDIAN